jgi:hypothetical protein
MPLIEDQINKELAEFDKLVEEASALDFGSLSHNKAMAKLQAFSAKVLSLDLKNLDQRIFELPIKLDQMVKSFIESNEKTSKANERYLRWQNILAGALVLATCGLIIATLVLALK